MGWAMEDGFNFKRLKEGILALSQSSTWEDARREWRLHYVYDADDPETCLCGHHPIIEVCVLGNNVNGSRTEVGNVCVHRFMKLASKLVFDCLKRIRKDDTKAANPATIELYYSRDVLNDWERDFSLSTWRKKSLSERQISKRRVINRKILNATKRIT